MSGSLVVTLGHNSSAIFVDDDGIIRCGYEEERLTGLKSDSHYPEQAIDEIRKYYKPDRAYVSNWFIDGKLPDVPTKHYNPLHLRRVVKPSNIMSVDQHFTHHDAHAYSAMAFRLSQHQAMSHKPMVAVMDGFGNFGETVSIYSYNDSLNLQMRSFGFKSSLGLFYQFATAFLGLKQNQDEYKLLGYESLIDTISLFDEFAFSALIDDVSQSFVRRITTIDSVISDEGDPLLSISALPSVQFYWNRMFEHVLKKHLAVNTEYNRRVLISHFVQSVVEETVIKILSSYSADEWILAGGLFMNVKLNMRIATSLGSRVCIMPLCGDQGAGLGLYSAINGFPKINDLNWGRRSGFPLGLDEREAAELAAYELKRDSIVNLVNREAMEFGARALGCTSTLALPTMENVEFINSLNNRSTIMPMAGVIREFDATQLHSSLHSIIGSMKYMICALPIRPRYIEDSRRGAMHSLPWGAGMTGRTQIVDTDHIFSHILDGIGGHLPMIINTSFNPHGLPIPFRLAQVDNARHTMERNNHSGREIVTIFYRG